MTAPTFHDGEIALQRRAGSYERMAAAGPRVIRGFMPDQHREFFALLPLLLAGSLDASGQPWASVLTGPAGFVHSPDAQLLRIDALPLPHDPLAGRLREGLSIGLLGIQPHTRRRNRMNGTVAALDAGGFSVRVDQSFGNCPKYIQAREPVYLPDAPAAGAPQAMDALDADARRAIAQADTFFIATGHPQAPAGAGQPAFGVDVSHRGGPPGFVRVDDDGVLRVPDFVGNGFFNTLGNLALEPRCNLLFIDYASGALLSVVARGSVEWTDQSPPRGTALTARRVRFDVAWALRIPGALPLHWT
ncbi:pyridoxamine 5'-phosphate oxidase family protein [Ramlibacter sp.]|uniref:pyridoxamine 5'-phosphate oxidase family protein n=1 Tax=Ramlibacter sp. TaxID=1917967 RepID=UPI0017F5418F|nr:pyridoxamine 5'-phosphate oxidase family protein [Ramlibacter sp.]MBA2674017.1 pyridoxamine 5'-phosphate oxidase family protein [Ramlibacter sp.]